MSNNEPPKYTPEEIDEFVRAREREEQQQYQMMMEDRRTMYDELPCQLIEDPNDPDLLIKYDKKDGRIVVSSQPVCKDTEISRIADRRLLDANVKYMVDEILPSGEIHIIGGPSGVGKTRWMLPFIKDWSEGKDIMGYKSFPEPYLYISCDRSAKSISQTMKKLGLQDWDLHFKTIDEILKDTGINDYTKLTLDAIFKHYKYIKVFIIEAIGWFQNMGNKVNQYTDNLRYWKYLQALIQEYQVTVIGSTHCPKAKPNEKYENPRERIMGSAAIGAIIETIFLLEFDNSKDVMNKKRIMRVMPRNVEETMYKFKMGPGGILVPLTEEEERESDTREKMVEDHSKESPQFEIMNDFLKTKDIIDIIQTGEILEYAERHGVSRATAYRWKDFKLESKELMGLSKGMYRRVNPS